MKGLVLVFMALLSISTAQAFDRIHGKKAIMNVYVVDIKTLDIVGMDSFAWPDLASCQDALPKAAAITMPLLEAGETVIFECKTMHRQGDTIMPGAVGDAHNMLLPKARDETIKQPIEFSTLDEAAIAGARFAYECSNVYECAGVIIKREGQFVVGPPGTSYSGDSSQISTAGAAVSTIVATYHSHPCLKSTHGNEYFSTGDIAGAYAAHTVSYMVDLCTGIVHVFDPFVDHPASVQFVTDGPWLTQGRVVGKIKLTRPIPPEPVTP